MTISENGINLIKKFEGFRSKAYLDVVGVPTIGYGSTIWNDGKKIIIGQQISLEGAEKLLQWEVNNKTASINALLPKTVITQNQFDALASFTYNLGVGALTGSTLIKKVKINPNDPTIKDEFMKWNHVRVGGKLIVNDGLTKRRAEEAALYYTV